MTRYFNFPIPVGVLSSQPKGHDVALGRECSDDYFGSTLSFLEKLGAEGLINYTTPEDLVIAKQLLELIIDHFGEDDAMVLMDIRDRHDEAERTSIPYHTYCKRLQRKIKSFIPILDKSGYC